MKEAGVTICDRTLVLGNTKLSVGTDTTSGANTGNYSSNFYFPLFPTRYNILFRLHTVSAILFPLYVSGLTGPSSGGLNCTCSLWYSAPLQMSLWCAKHTTKTSAEYHRLHVQFRPPDDGPVRPETCRGKRIADTVCRRKRILYRVGNKGK